MRVKLLKDLGIGRRNEVIDVTTERARYLLKVGAALEWKQTAEVDDDVEDVELTEAEAVKPRVVKKKKTAKKTAKK